MSSLFYEFLSFFEEAFFWEKRNKIGEKIALPSRIAVGKAKNRAGHFSSISSKNGKFLSFCCIVLIFQKKRRAKIQKMAILKKRKIPIKRRIKMLREFFIIFGKFEKRKLRENGENFGRKIFGKILKKKYF